MKQAKCTIHDEQGMTLVEILGAVTIMSIITVFLMGYLVSAIENSSEQNRRLIAANLARQKVAEVRKVFADGTQFTQLLAVFQARSTDNIAYGGNDMFLPLSLQPETINDTRYQYVVEFDISNSGQRARLHEAIAAAQEFIVPIRVTVFWTHSELGQSSARYSVMIPSNVVKAGG